MSVTRRYIIIMWTQMKTKQTADIKKQICVHYHIHIMYMSIQVGTSYMVIYSITVDSTQKQIRKYRRFHLIAKTC